MSKGSSRHCVMAVEPLDVSVPPEAAVVSFARAAKPAILDSSLRAAICGRYSVFACEPMAEFAAPADGRGCPLRAFADQFSRFTSPAHFNSDLPFVAGWIGFFSYEAGLNIENITCGAGRGPAVPLAGFRLYDASAVYDHDSDQWYLTGVDWPEPIASHRPDLSFRLDRLRCMLEAARREKVAPHGSTAPLARVTPDMSEAEYSARVERAKRYIAAGEIYQVNLTQHWEALTDLSPLELYLRLRRLNPSSHAAFLGWDDFAVISSSPELFLDLRRGHVITRPIKGTRPRSADPRADQSLRQELADSEKERAELNMIVDLLRNDLGRVCEFGSIRVREAGVIEQHPTVYHRVATIEGDLAEGRDWLDLMLAAYPGGSVTGAPKIRAMQIIGELEPVRRGVYCGAIGMVGLDGSISLNVAIRTMVQSGRKVHVHAGGAIVADSCAGQEYAESIAKAAGMMRALGALGPKHRPRLDSVTAT